MITRKALEECLNKAIEDLKDAPSDGMLAYLTKTYNRGCSFAWTDHEAQILALAYVYAVRMEQRS
jgi:hypothetical protein